MLLLALALGPAAASAGFAAHAELTPTGCAQTVVGNVVRVDGCVARGRFGGTARGRIELAYRARVDIAKGTGTQQGTITLRGASPADRLVLRFTGSVTINTGASRGRWQAVERQGAFRKSAPAAGTYSSRSPDQGVHVTFDVRG